MEKGTLNSFTSDINDIREYIKHINIVNDVEIAHRTSTDEAIIKLRDHLHSFGFSKKLFEYKSITISLYGILEKYIGLWTKEFVSQLPKIILDYNCFTEKFREDHFHLSVKLLSLIGDKKLSKYEKIKREDVLSKLSSCIETPHNFELNSDAFYLHSGNLRHSRISETLNTLDIKITDRLKAISQRQNTFLSRSHSDIANKGEELFRLIDELVDRRNDIAHGEDIDNILSITEFEDYVDFLEEYGRAVHQALSEKINQFEADFLYKEIANVKGIFKNGSVLCFEIENSEIRKGDKIIVKLHDGGFIKKEILEIQKNNETFEKISITGIENIGVNLGKGISNGQKFFIKKLNNTKNFSPTN